MSNEEKILAMLTTMQKDMATMKADIDELKQNAEHNNKLDNEGIKRQLAVVENLSNLLTKEEADALAAVVGE